MRVKVLALVVVFAFAGCSKAPEREIGITQNLANAQMVQALAGLPVAPMLPDVGYALVDSAALAGYYKEFKTNLFNRDVVKWEGRFDCNKFATAYASGAQMRFYRERFHSWAPNQAVAIGEVWYRRQGLSHAVNIAVTEWGVIWIEPQTGDEFTPTDAERRSVFFIKF